MWAAPREEARPLAQVLPLYAPGHVSQGALLGAGYGTGDALRRIVGTSSAVLPPPDLGNHHLMTTVDTVVCPDRDRRPMRRSIADRRGR